MCVGWGGGGTEISQSRRKITWYIYPTSQNPLRGLSRYWIGTLPLIFYLLTSKRFSPRNRRNLPKERWFTWCAHRAKLQVNYWLNVIFEKKIWAFCYRNTNLPPLSLTELFRTSYPMGQNIVAITQEARKILN